MNRITRLSLRIVFLCSMGALSASEAPSTTPVAILAPIANKLEQGSTQQNSLITSIALAPIWHATKPMLSSALNVAQKYWPITLALTCVVFRKPIMNFIKGSIMSLIWGDAVAAIDQRTTAIQDELRPIRATAEALGQQIAALPEQQRQALAAQTEAIRTHIEQLEKTAQDATTDAFAHAQTQISELRTQLTALSEQVARDTAENQQRLTALESGQVAMHTELTSNHAELCRHIETIDERLIGLEQRITGQLGQIAILCARRSAITFPLTGYLATINAHPFRSHSLFPSATIQEMFRTSTRALPDNRSSSKDESACHFNA